MEILADFARALLIIAERLFQGMRGNTFLFQIQLT
jgi:hypothetical protein